MNLVNFRKSWEKDSNEELVVPVMIDNFVKVYVILSRVAEKGYTDGLNFFPPKLKYSLHRYLRTGMNPARWDVSVDIKDTKDIEDCIENIKLDTDLRDLYTNLSEMV